MKKRVTIVLEVESEDEINMDDRFIQQDLEQEISCASNRYEMISFRTQKLEEENKKRIKNLLDSLSEAELFEPMKHFQD